MHPVSLLPLCLVTSKRHGISYKFVGGTDLLFIPHFLGDQKVRCVHSHIRWQSLAITGE